MKLEDPAPESQERQIFRAQLSNSTVKGKTIRQRRQHQVKQANGQKIIHAIGNEPAAFRRAQVQKPGRNGREAGGDTSKQSATRNKYTKPSHKEYPLFVHAESCRQTNKPPEPRDKMAFQRKQAFRHFACSSRKQIDPITSEREGVKRYLQTKTDS